jgi:pseudaminic acid biosynthesis-associated methylase
LGIEAWQIMTRKISSEMISSVFEVGSNIGRNIDLISQGAIFPNANLSASDINPKALNQLKETFAIYDAVHLDLVNLSHSGKYDFVFTSGVLIHIDPKNLLSAVTNLFRLSSKYVLIAEYFNRTPTSIQYQGEDHLLFKCDFGKFVLSNFQVSLVDYGFLWGNIYDAAGFDDMTFWLFQVT